MKQDVQPPQPQQRSILYLITEVIVPLKYLSNFWRSFNLTFINCEIELDLRWSALFILLEDNNKITEVTLSLSDNIIVLENIPQGFKRTVFGTKFRSAITTQPKKQQFRLHS